jgi:NAD(P)-dependent dehydrogenase (short-subunit alcohol dehydrogenase family)
MRGRFEKKAVIVTGGAAGIGRATAVAFGREGARVVVADVNLEGAEATATMVGDAGGEALAVQTDVSEDGAVRAMVDRCVEAFGGLDVAFNNAGIEGAQGVTHECTMENWDRVVDVNLKGTWLCMRHQIPRMIEGGGGAIVNMASVAGLVGFPAIPAYTAAKHGVIGLTRTAALDYATQNIRVNVVCPGVILTEMVERYAGSAENLEAMAAMAPVNRLGRPEEIAEAVLFLASAQASFVTGHPLAIDGGFVMR